MQQDKIEKKKQGKLDILLKKIMAQLKRKFGEFVADLYKSGTSPFWLTHCMCTLGTYIAVRNVTVVLYFIWQVTLSNTSDILQMDYQDISWKVCIYSYYTKSVLLPNKNRSL